MIYTVTLNPSLDYVMQTENFQLGVVNRTIREEILAGGKGINVSIVLKNLGINSIALGFVAGFTGDEIERSVRRYDLNTDFVRLSDGLSRINVKLKSKEETEINAQGPKIQDKDVAVLFHKLDKLTSGDVLVLCGSIPNSLSNDIYDKIITYLQGRDVLFVVDATKELLRNVLKHKPFLIKPNHLELSELFGKTLTSREELISHAIKLKDEGAQNILISMAGEGAILITEDGSIFDRKAPKGIVVNSVGAGDSMVAGFLAGYLQNHNYEDALTMGIAAGSASAFSKEFATIEEVNKLLPLI